MTYAPRRLFARPRALQNKSKILLIATFLLLLAVQQKQFWVQLLPSKSHVTGPFLNTRRDSDIIRLKDLPDLTTAYTKVSNGNHSFALSLIRENGNLRISSDLEAILPDNDEIEGLYGSGPVIFGLDTCKQFQSMYEPKERYIGIAGQMNSGTNAAGKLLTANFNHSANVHAIVPWNKHSWVSLRGVYNFSKTPVSHDQFLPIVLVRDPYFWMKSMCESPYTMRWKHSPDRCPNLKNASVSISWNSNRYYQEYDSLAHVWNDWYRGYVEASFPRLIVRFEDLLFWHTDEVLQAISDCVDSPLMRYKSPPVISTEPVKQGEYYERIKKQSSWLSALIKTNGYRDLDNAEDSALANSYLDKELMRIFHYKE